MFPSQRKFHFEKLSHHHHHHNRETLKRPKSPHPNSAEFTLTSDNNEKKINFYSHLTSARSESSEGESTFRSKNILPITINKLNFSRGEGSEGEDQIAELTLRENYHPKYTLNIGHQFSNFNGKSNKKFDFEQRQKNEYEKMSSFALLNEGINLLWKNDSEAKELRKNPKKMIIKTGLKDLNEKNKNILTSESEQANKGEKVKALYIAKGHPILTNPLKGFSNYPNSFLEVSKLKDPKKDPKGFQRFVVTCDMKGFKDDEISFLVKYSNEIQVTGIKKESGEEQARRVCREFIHLPKGVYPDKLIIARDTQTGQLIFQERWDFYDF